MLSKESGKIGVTITTSSPSGTHSPPPKLPRLIPIKPISSPTSPSFNQQRVNGRRPSSSSTRSDREPTEEASEANAIPSASSPTVLTATTPRTNSEKRSPTSPASLPLPSATKPDAADVSSVPKSSVCGETREARDTPDTAKSRLSDTTNGHTEVPVRTVDSVVSALLNFEKLPVNGHCNNNNNNVSNVVSEVKDPPVSVNPIIVNHVLTSPGSDYWLARNPVADQVFITDVTVNTETVTIRECKTEKGFFRERNDLKSDT